MLFSTSGEIKISPFQVERVLELRIKKKINKHSRLYLKAILIDTQTDQPVIITKESTEIKVEVTGENKKVLFVGLTKYITVKQEGGLYELELEAVSNSILLDIQKKNKSFQDVTAKYSDLVKKIVSEYGGDIIDTASKGSSIGGFTLQYKETDWEFLKRMASRFHAGLVPADTFNAPKIYFGAPEEIERGCLTEYNYTARKKISHYMKSSKNTNPSLQEMDTFEYEIISDKFLDIGNTVTYKDRKYYVSTVYIKSSQGIIQNKYILKTQNGLSKDEVFNNRITGISLKAKVLSVNKDQLKVEFDIKKGTNGNSSWFPYTTAYTAEGNSGWYLMPEINDTVLIYFPENKEENAVGINSIRTQNNAEDKISDPGVKYFRTNDGKELKFDKNEILISAKDDEIYIKLNEESGIEIVSSLPVTINTQGDLSINADKKITMEAEEEINLTCKSSTIKMDDNIVLQGKEVRNN